MCSRSTKKSLSHYCRVFLLKNGSFLPIVCCVVYKCHKFCYWSAVRSNMFTPVPTFYFPLPSYPLPPPVFLRQIFHKLFKTGLLYVDSSHAPISLSARWGNAKFPNKKLLQNDKVHMYSMLSLLPFVFMFAMRNVAKILAIVPSFEFVHIL